MPITTEAVCTLRTCPMVNNPADSHVTAAELYDHYCAWATTEEIEPVSATAFGRRIKGRLQSQKTKQGRIYKGIARKEIAPPEPEVTG